MQATIKKPKDMEVAYPRLIRRIQAVLVDSILIPLAAFSVLFVINSSSWWINVGAMLLIILILEPVLVSFTGATIGHHLFRIRIRRVTEDKNLNIILALIRFIVKYGLGLPSLLFIFLTKKHRALHDIASGSIVVHKSVEGVPEYELLAERTLEDEKEIYASKSRRLGIIIVYWVIVTIGLNFLMFPLVSLDCLNNDICTSNEETILGMIGLLWLILILTTAILGWKGKLYGCRSGKP
jgi:uncharacterized RDD family membrane protein YckC